MMDELDAISLRAVKKEVLTGHVPYLRRKLEKIKNVPEQFKKYNRILEMIINDNVKLTLDEITKINLKLKAERSQCAPQKPTSDDRSNATPNVAVIEPSHRSNQGQKVNRDPRQIPVLQSLHSPTIAHPTNTAYQRDHQVQNQSRWDIETRPNMARTTQGNVYGFIPTPNYHQFPTAYTTIQQSSATTFQPPHLFHFHPFPPMPAAPPFYGSNNYQAHFPRLPPPQPRQPVQQPPPQPRQPVQQPPVAKALDCIPFMIKQEVIEPEPQMTEIPKQRLLATTRSMTRGNSNVGYKGFKIVAKPNLPPIPLTELDLSSIQAFDPEPGSSNKKQESEIPKPSGIPKQTETGSFNKQPELEVPKLPKPAGILKRPVLGILKPPAPKNIERAQTAAKSSPDDGFCPNLAFWEENDPYKPLKSPTEKEPKRVQFAGLSPLDETNGDEVWSSKPRCPSSLYASKRRYSIDDHVKQGQIKKIRPRCNVEKYQSKTFIVKKPATSVEANVFERAAEEVIVEPVPAIRPIVSKSILKQSTDSNSSARPESSSGQQPIPKTGTKQSKPKNQPASSSAKSARINQPKLKFAFSKKSQQQQTSALQMKKFKEEKLLKSLSKAQKVKDVEPKPKLTTEALRGKLKNIKLLSSSIEISSSAKTTQHVEPQLKLAVTNVQSDKDVETTPAAPTQEIEAEASSNTSTAVPAVKNTKQEVAESLKIEVTTSTDISTEFIEEVSIKSPPPEIADHSNASVEASSDEDLFHEDEANESSPQKHKIGSGNIQPSDSLKTRFKLSREKLQLLLKKKSTDAEPVSIVQKMPIQQQTDEEDQSISSAEQNSICETPKRDKISIRERINILKRKRSKSPEVAVNIQYEDSSEEPGALKATSEGIQMPENELNDSTAENGEDHVDRPKLMSSVKRIQVAQAPTVQRKCGRPRKVVKNEHLESTTEKPDSLDSNFKTAGSSKTDLNDNIANDQQTGDGNQQTSFVQNVEQDLAPPAKRKRGRPCKVDRVAPVTAKIQTRESSEWKPIVQEHRKRSKSLFEKKNSESPEWKLIDQKPRKRSKSFFKKTNSESPEWKPNAQQSRKRAKVVCPEEAKKIDKPRKSVPKVVKPTEASVGGKEKNRELNSLHEHIADMHDGPKILAGWNRRSCTRKGINYAAKPEHIEEFQEDVIEPPVEESQSLEVLKKLYNLIDCNIIQINFNLAVGQTIKMKDLAVQFPFLEANAVVKENKDEDKEVLNREVVEEDLESPGVVEPGTSFSIMVPNDDEISETLNARKIIADFPRT